MVDFTDADINKMRAQLAKTWRQSKAQVTDNEAIFYLELERELGDKCQPQSHKQPQEKS